MANSECHVCSQIAIDDGYPYKCAYCGRPVCAEHRLPEEHRCTGDRSEDIDDVQSRSAKRMELDEEQLPGHTTEPEFESGPDVSLDGSVRKRSSSQNQGWSLPTDFNVSLEAYWKRFSYLLIWPIILTALVVHLLSWILVAHMRSFDFRETVDLPSTLIESPIYGDLTLVFVVGAVSGAVLLITLRT